MLENALEMSRVEWRYAYKRGEGQVTVILLNSGETGGVLSWESLRGDISHTQVRYFLDEGERISRKKI